MIVVGIGAIGGRFAQLAKAFDMRVIALRRDPTLGKGAADAVHATSELKALLPEADFVVLTCPLTTETEKLIDADPAPNTQEADRLDLLILLANDYEAKEFPTELPDAVEAIKFRMEQQDLAPRDLIPYIGSRSKVSEVLARKRPLTLSMVRALHERLHVPAKALIQQAELLEPVKEEPDWNRFPVRHMVSRGWIDDCKTIGAFVRGRAIFIEPRRHTRRAAQRDKDPPAIGRCVNTARPFAHWKSFADAICSSINDRYIA